MNLNIINLDCDKWTKADWNDAYNQYCQHNMFGEKTKREYYDFVHENQKRLFSPQEPLSDELKRTWTIGRRNAALWAKKHGCDMNGRLIKDIEFENRNCNAIDVAERAEDIALDTMQQLDILLSKVGQKKV